MNNSPITVMTEDECWDFLVQNELGRIAFVMAGEPEILPINYVVLDRRIVFRTAEGTKMLGVAMAPRVAFEVDSYGAVQAKSVVVHGRAEVVDTTEGIERCMQLPLHPWVPTVKNHFVEVVVDAVSGRKFTLGELPEDEQGF